MKYLGIIVNLEESRAVALTDESTFIEIKKRKNMFLGQKVLIYKSDIIDSSKRMIRHYTPVIAGIAAVLIFMFGYFGFSRMNEPYAYIDADINPSLEFAIDKENYVKEVRALNEDAAGLIWDIDLKNIPFEDALKIYVEWAQEKGYLQENKGNGNFLLVSAALNPGSKEYKKDKIVAEKRLEVVLDALKINLHKMYDQKINTQVVIVPDYYKKKSEENKISMGKYLVYEKSRENGKPITLEEVQSENLSSLLENHRISLTGVGDNTGISETTSDVSQEIEPTVNDTTVGTQANQPTSSGKVPGMINTPGKTPIPKVTMAKPTPLPTLLWAPASTPKPVKSVVPLQPADTAQYNFENGLQDFATLNGGKADIVSTNPYAGSKCIRISLNPEMDEFVRTTKISPDITCGTTIIFHVWVPANADITAVEPYYQNCKWEWRGNWTDYSKLTPNAWNTILLKVSKDESLPVKALGVKFAAKGKKFSGNVYIDSISWK